MPKCWEWQVSLDYFEISRHLIKNMLISTSASACSMKIILDYISITVTQRIHLWLQREKWSFYCPGSKKSICADQMKVLLIIIEIVLPTAVFFHLFEVQPIVGDAGQIRDLNDVVQNKTFCLQLPIFSSIQRNNKNNLQRGFFPTFPKCTSHKRTREKMRNVCRTW